MSVCIIDYNAGNTASVRNALDRLEVDSLVSNHESDIREAHHVIFPGVGHAAPAMASLRAHGLDTVIPSLKQPFLGICLGLQLLCAYSEEGDTHGLGVFSEKVQFLRDSPKVPHMGWNLVQPSSSGSKLLEGADYYYFVHSYAAALGENVAAQTCYGQAFAASLEKDNFFAVQFHPEKSGDAGERILRRFLTL